MKNQLNPKYEELFQLIGSHLNDRKGDLAKRILLISLPLMIIGGTAYVLKESGFINTATEFQQTIVMVAFACFALLSIVYYGVFSFILAIEKRIWIDSTFDNKKIESKESWRLAWKLTLPVIAIILQVFLRYIIPAIVVCVAVFMLMFYVNVLMGSKSTFLIYMIQYLVWAAATYAYMYYLIKIKLRFFPFLFIDLYNPAGYSAGVLFTELKKLNKISGTEGFKQALLVNVGADSVQALTRLALRSLFNKVSLMGHAGGFLAAVARPLADEANRQYVSYARITAIYIIYREARKELYGEEQHINPYIYSLMN